MNHTPAIAGSLVRCVINFTNARIDTAYDAFRAAPFGHREQGADPEHRKACAEREPLHHTARDTEPREGSRPFAESDAVEIAQPQVPAFEQPVDHAEDEIGMTLARARFAHMRVAVDPQSGGAIFSGSVERENFQIAVQWE